MTLTRADHQRHADAVPPDIKMKLSRTELRLRCDEMERLHSAAAVSGLEPEVARYLTSRARRIAKAIPVFQFLERKRQLGHLIDGAGHDARVAYRAVAAKLKSDNKYPDGLEAACDAALLSRPTTLDAESIARHHRG